MTIIYLNVSLSQNYQPGAASTQGDESFRYFLLWFAGAFHLISEATKDIQITTCVSKQRTF